MDYITGDSKKNVTNPIHQTWPYKLKSIPYSLWSFFSNKFTLWRFFRISIKDYFFTTLMIVYSIGALIYGYYNMPKWLDYQEDDFGRIMMKLGHVCRRPMPANLFGIFIPLPKNNFSIGGIFGSSYQDVLSMHKVSGWAFGLFSVLHSVFYIIGVYRTGGNFQSHAYKYGIFCFAFICVLMLGVFIRRKYYNLFHKIHIVSFVFVIITYIWHVQDFSKNGSYKYYLYIPLGLYLIDVFFRILHLIFPAKIESKVVTKTGYIVLKFKKNIFYNPTQYIDILIPSVSPISFHPFSLVCSNFVDIMKSKKYDETQSLLIDDGNDEKETPIVEKKSHQSEMCVVIAPFGPWTNRLKETSEAKLKKLPMFVMNPVGRPPCPLRNYKQKIIIGTGIGFAPMLGHLQALCMDDQIHEVDCIMASRENDLAITFADDFICAKKRIIGNIVNYCEIGREECERLNGVVEFKDGIPNFHEIAETYAGKGDILVIAFGSERVTGFVQKGFQNVPGANFVIYVENGKF